MNRSYVLDAFIETPWAILPSKLAMLEEIVMRHVAGERLDADEVQARIDGAKRPQQKSAGSVAVLPLFGTIFPRADMFSDISGGTSAESFGNEFMGLVNNPSVNAIVIDVDSPGGSIYGVEEAAQKIFNARGAKPIVAVANHQMASAAYWIGTAADEVVVSPSGDVGSIGVFTAHRDLSGAYEKQGVKVSLISAGKHKVIGNSYEPLSEEARSVIQASVNEAYDEFVDAVARNRGVKASIVKSSFGEGRMVSARHAVELGMADRVGTLQETVDRLLNQNISSGALANSQTGETSESFSSSETVQMIDHEREHRLERLRERVIKQKETN